jgi:hypothetical protein
MGLYDETFAGMSAAAIHAHARELGLAGDFARALGGPFALCLLLLGGDYLRATQISKSTKVAGPTVAFCSAAAARRLIDTPRLHCVPAGQEEARRYSCGLVGLKGEMAGRLLEVLAKRPDLIDVVPHESTSGLLDMLDGGRTAPAAVAA